MAILITPLPQFTNLLSDSEQWIEIESEHMSGTAGNYTSGQSNLMGWMRLRARKADGVTFDYIVATLLGSYSTKDKRVAFNIGGLFHLRNVPPDDLSIGTVLHTTQFQYGDNYLYGDVQYADQFGDPPAPVNIKTAGKLYIFAGALMKTSVDDFDISTEWGTILHSYRTPDNMIIPVPTSPDAPQWVYLYSGGSTSLDKVVKLTYYDGTSSSYTLSEPIQEDAVYAIQTGYAQLDIDANKTPGKEVARYEVTIRRNASANYKMGKVVYEMVGECEDSDTIILYANGVGGCEAVRMRGKPRTKSSVSSTRALSGRYINTGIRGGSVIRSSISAIDRVEISTGYYSTDYIRHVRQLIVGEAWRIDRVNNRFIKIVIETAEVDVHDELEDLHELTITYRDAFTDEAFNEYRQQYFQ